MPELPEVEAVRRGLERAVVGPAVTAVEVRRPDIVVGPCDHTNLLGHTHVETAIRHGKQLALVGVSGAVVCVHLGMSGSLTFVGDPAARPAPPHTHVVWRLAGGGELRFADPRRFGGVWVFHNVEQLWKQRWAFLGPDALQITPGRLGEGLSRTRRGLKAALLDQALIAGLGNIYVDELLFACGLHPLVPAHQVNPAQLPGVVRRMRRLLGRAIEAGGSSLRDYRDADGRPGSYQRSHKVYGRAGLPCARCGRSLASAPVAGRTTVWCPACQRAPR